ncbi:Indolepyruvate oxidoreductase subunit IorB II [Rubellimicrobium mesophilum DSM 19309]|uniref:Indolepyruvate oxidoreductase subunit IorB II n=1 Tax=Rubellimicrobium mesophilum DSM 19309 TaxID=442562 RepID=A0A017HRP5_9RHOB|nr:Indolepyruvate oxidoreductase subunit IorB II [Rubellimicrobium mesophilum DSM 19309]
MLAGWIEDLARANGYLAQATSVAGVAQRTGATIYYVEMCPDSGRQPVFALLPSAGDVDVLVAAEMMEAGRAILRGFVTPDRTVLVASTHRALAVSEKTVPGDGIASSEEVVAAAEVAARRVVMADFEAIAVREGSVISASLFGGLAASGALPFPREAFEAAIRAGGKGVEGSLGAFRVACEAAGAAPATAPVAVIPVVDGPLWLREEWERLRGRMALWPATVVEMAGAGLRKVVDFQDVAYGDEYLDLVGRVMARDDAARGWALSQEAAKYLANAMAYDDVIRVADLKTRGGRFARIEGEMGAGDGRLLHVTEFMHPRAEEVVGMLPARVGARVEASPRAMRWIGRLFARGRRVRTDGLVGFLVLHALGGMKGRRRRTLRDRWEREHRTRWMALALGQADYGVAVEVIRCRRLIKGYSDTHARGLSKFDRVLSALPMLEGREDAAEWVRRLREAALKDEGGKALDEALRTVRSFAGEA